MASTVAPGCPVHSEFDPLSPRYFCLGSALGKLEAELAVAELARRWPELALVEDQDLTFHPNISFRGPQALWVSAVPGGAA